MQRFYHYYSFIGQVKIVCIDVPICGDSKHDLKTILGRCCLLTESGNHFCNVSDVPKNVCVGWGAGLPNG